MKIIFLLRVSCGFSLSKEKPTPLRPVQKTSEGFICFIWTHEAFRTHARHKCLLFHRPVARWTCQQPSITTAGCHSSITSNRWSSFTVPSLFAQCECRSERVDRHSASTWMLHLHLELQSQCHELAALTSVCHSPLLPCESTFFFQTLTECSSLKGSDSVCTFSV